MSAMGGKRTLAALCCAEYSFTMNDAASSARDSKVEPRWLLPVSYTGAVALFVALALLRDEPWTKGSVAGLVLASCLSIGVFRIAGKILLGLHVSPVFYGPPIEDSAQLGWLHRPLGTLLQFIIVTSAAAGVALIG